MNPPHALAAPPHGTSISAPEDRGTLRWWLSSLPGFRFLGNKGPCFALTLNALILVLFLDVGMAAGTLGTAGCHQKLEAQLAILPVSAARRTPPGILAVLPPSRSNTGEPNEGQGSWLNF